MAGMHIRLQPKCSLWLQLVCTEFLAAYLYTYYKVGAFLPVILEQLARENGVFFSDRTKPCVEVQGAGSHRMRNDVGQKETEQCMVEFLGKTMSTSSFAMYTFSAAVILQAVTLVCFSSFADHGRLSVPLALSWGPMS
jgi:UMF1 family MFS transporter